MNPKSRSPSSTRVIFVAKATHVLNDKFCWKKLDHLLYYLYDYFLHVSSNQLRNKY
jgi:uncharacterized phage-associated protein